MINLNYLNILLERPKMQGIDMVNAGLLDHGAVTFRSNEDKIEFLTQCKALLEADPASTMGKCDIALGLTKNQTCGFLKWLRLGRLGEGHEELIAFFDARTAAHPNLTARARNKKQKAEVA